ncbi:hypothetical protein JOF41_006598 [Saccharothrix coeruleofusca]|uniref:hypothetical protein n=1 Tax=Saccharothrix coeruleofusca TaxID=33919 RepID=UPI001AE9FB74|nr:hypothetical protein [Saccharothrix coeruleofusca]MBP2340420.1 hypothetical protein [Saccharothrix coeruleofusca]
MKVKFRFRMFATLGLLVAALFASPFTSHAGVASTSGDFQANAWRIAGGPWPNNDQGRRQCDNAAYLLMERGTVRAAQCLVDGETGTEIWLWGDFI